jgi:hypothetical protein
MGRLKMIYEIPIFENLLWLCTEAPRIKLKHHLCYTFVHQLMNAPAVIVHCFMDQEKTLVFMDDVCVLS